MVISKIYKKEEEKMIEKGKNAIVTGASGSMSTQLCRMLAQRGKSCYMLG